MEGDKETVVIGDGQDGFWKQATVCGLPVLGMESAAWSHICSALSTSLFLHFSVFFVSSSHPKSLPIPNSLAFYQV